MFQVSNELLLQLFAAVVSGGAVYGGIRADLKAMHAQIQEAKETAIEAHRRLDNHMDHSRTR